MKYLIILSLLLIVSCKENETRSKISPYKEMALMSELSKGQSDFTPKKITKTGILKFENKNLNECHDYVIDLMKATNGLVISEEYLSDYNYSYKFETMVPSSKFDSIISVLIKKYGEPEFYKVEIDDFTDSYYDTDARLRSKKAYLEKCYEILKNAKKISDLLEIESKISRTIEEIETMTRKIKNYDNLTENFNLEISFHNYEKKSDKETSFFETISNSFKSGFIFAKDSISFVISKWPLWIFIFVVFGLYRYVKRKKRINRKTN